MNIILQASQLAGLLLSIKDKAKFAVDGILRGSPLPGLNIKGVGPVSFPLCEEQAKKIISVSRQAPYGLGEKTLVDESVR